MRKPLAFRIRKKIYDRDNHTCLKCGTKVNLFSRYFGDLDVGEIDHILPKSRGGTETEENLQLLCLLCNRRKYNHEVV